MTHWHASADRHPPGTVLRPSPGYEDRWDALSAGRILEGLRPPGATPHREVVFLCETAQACDDCGAVCEWLHGAIPEGPASRHDLAHASEIDCLISEGIDPSDPMIAEIAGRYWSGERCGDSRGSAWETLCRSAVVVSVEPW